MRIFTCQHTKTDFGNLWKFEDSTKMSSFSMYSYDDDPKTVYISDVFVDDLNRHKGIGNAILGEAEDRAAYWGMERIRLRVVGSSWMRRWYERHGYRFLVDDTNKNYDWLEKNIAVDEDSACTSPVNVVSSPRTGEPRP